MIVIATVEVGLVIIAEASLSFLGLGTPPSQPSWGQTIAQGRDYLNNAWWISTIPGIALCLVVISASVCLAIGCGTISTRVCKRGKELGEHQRSIDLMEQRCFGSSGICSSVIGFGTWPIGGARYGKSDDAEAIAAIQAALDAGVTLFDTAPSYGNGHAEELLGQGTCRSTRPKPSS